MRRTQVLAISLVLFAAQSQGQPGKNPEVQKLGDAFVAAWNKADAKALAALHAENAIRSTPQGEIIVGRAAIEKAFADALAGELKGTRLVVKPGDERTVTNDVIVSAGTWEVTGGTPPPGAATRGTYVNTVLRQGGRWMIASSAPIPAPTKQ